MKISPVGAELLHADRQTDMTNLIIALCNIAHAPKNIIMMFSHAVSYTEVMTAL